MSGRPALERMSEAKLRSWLLARMRAEEQDPPVTETRLETADDYVRSVHQQSQDAKFRARLQKAAVEALREAGAGDLHAGNDARAVRDLAAMVDALDVRDAAPVLQAIAERGALGSRESGFDQEVEGAVLFALAGLQAPAKLWSRWEALWRRDVPHLWPVATAGLRLSDPRRALGIISDAIARTERHGDFPLGEVLWSFATDRRYGPSEIPKAFGALDETARERARAALAEVGATAEQIAAWVPDQPAHRSQQTPVWASRPGLALTEPPRVSDYVDGAEAA